MKTLNLCRMLSSKKEASFARRSLSMSSKHLALQDVLIINAARTPIGSFRSCFANIPATELGSIAIKAALEEACIRPLDVQEVYMGNVCQANLGQAPARQAALGAGLGFDTPCTTVNKVCASGLKSIILAAQTLQSGHQQLMLAGGMESMSNVPFYLARGELPYGGTSILDGIVKDGLTDAYGDHFHMGKCAEKTAKEMGISRQMQDEYAIGSYAKSAKAWATDRFRAEIVPVTVKSRKGDTVIRKDEEFAKVDLNKMTKLKTVFEKDGTITAGNASTLNDGGAAVILSTAEKIVQLELTPSARVVAFGDAAVPPADFSLAPIVAVEKVLKMAGLTPGDVDVWEINEAFSVVVLACMRKLALNENTVNVDGGAVSLGHPIGMSGARLVVHLIHILKPGQKGLAAICNGGGGASALILEKF